MTFELQEALPTDAACIAQLLLSAWETPFARLQFENADREMLKQAMASRIRSTIESPDSSIELVVMRDLETGQVASVAQWALPEGESGNRQGEDEAEDLEELEQLRDAGLRASLPEGANKDLIVDFYRSQRKLRDAAVGNRTHYHLLELATHSSYRQQGLATRLVSWSFCEADKNAIPLYLDVCLQNTRARQLYKKLGFKEAGRSTINLVPYGGVEVETHIAMVRQRQ